MNRPPIILNWSNSCTPTPYSPSYTLLTLKETSLRLKFWDSNWGPKLSNTYAVASYTNEASYKTSVNKNLFNLTQKIILKILFGFWPQIIINDV